jgi:hypothetical protein
MPEPEGSDVIVCPSPIEKSQFLTTSLSTGHDLLNRHFRVGAFAMRGFDESPEEFTFVSVIDDPRRFTKSRNVGAYLGLTPRCYQSCEVDRSGRIFRCGVAPMCGQQNPQGNRPLHPKMSRT